MNIRKKKQKSVVSSCVCVYRAYIDEGEDCSKPKSTCIHFVCIERTSPDLSSGVFFYFLTSATIMT